MGEILVIGLGSMLLLRGAWSAWWKRDAESTGVELSRIPNGLSLRPQAILSRQEAEFYNILRLAVQEQYLIFAKVPLWSLITARAKDPHDQTVAVRFLKSMPKKRMDFVLVHPGTLAVETVVQLGNAHLPRSGNQGRQKLVQRVFQEAGIKLVTVNTADVYSVPALASLLGVEPRE